ncbi:MAG: GPW/gp25 family protein [Eubacteriales bacterium]|nr:GPW/gp25 family protein [Eubacteriales bacterium]
MADQLFLGTGMKFPPQVNKTTGRFLTASGSQSVKESIYLILMTQRTERFMRPEFGSNILSYTFADMGSGMLTMMASDLTDTITQQEPRVTDVDVEMDGESRPGCLFINIGYTIRESNVRENMVFPFYLNVGPEEKGDTYETMDDDISQ